MKRSLGLSLTLLVLSGMANADAGKTTGERFPNGSIQVGNVEIHQFCQYGLQFLVAIKDSNSPHMIQVTAPNGSPLACQTSLVPENPKPPKK